MSVQGEPRMRRRGILAAAGAVVAGMAATRAAQPVRATTDYSYSAANGSGYAFFTQTTGYSVGAAVSGTFYGVAATGRTSHGVWSSTEAATGSGAAGVYGIGNGSGTFGILGDAFGGVGVQGQGGQYGVVGVPNSVPNSIGVWGNNTSTQAGAIGVYGNAPNGIGVFGTTSAAGQYGVIGQTLVDNAFGLAGIANTNGSAAFAGGTANPSSFAASFQGHVQVDGVFDVIGAGNKHAVVPHPDGTHRTIYSIESPECWVEDFGEGTLTGGTAEVALEKEFAALMHTDQYHVFLTPHGDYHLHVARRHRGGFTIQADLALAALKGKKASDLTGTFSWRVVAKPKTEAKVERLAKATLAPKMDFSKLPRPPIAPPVAASPPKPGKP